jgi:cytochrome b
MAQGGPFARSNLNDSFLLLLMFVISTAVPSLVLSADVAERQRAQDQEHLLLRELSHRVGNTLAVLSLYHVSGEANSSVAESKPRHVVGSFVISEEPP